MKLNKTKNVGLYDINHVSNFGICSYICMHINVVKAVLYYSSIYD
jgi:hypothetical protein